MELGVDVDYEQVRVLARDFGICTELARSAEACFESCETHGAAIEFVGQFARALVEGADVQPRDVRTFWYDREGDGDWPDWETPDVLDGSCHWLEPEDTEAFLTWLRSMEAGKRPTTRGSLPAAA